MPSAASCYSSLLQFIEKYQGDWLPPDTVPPHGTRNVDFVLWTGDGHPPDERVEGNADGQVRALFPHQGGSGLRVAEGCLSCACIRESRASFPRMPW